MTPTPHADLATDLNASCFCMTLDREHLLAALQRSTHASLPWATLAETHPHLFADVPSFVSRGDMDTMERVVGAIERVAALPAYARHVAPHLPPIAVRDHGQHGAMMGYDFHLTPHGPRLIEINTNAGGAFLNAVLRDAQKVCCPAAGEWLAAPGAGPFAARVATMFEAEWHAQFPERPLTTIAIVDEKPAQQYLYPEFLLAQALLERQGLKVLIADPADLVFDGQKLTTQGTSIDLVYNRHVDFMLEGADLAALRTAYLQGSVALTPTPRNHALLANKANLTTLSDPSLLATLGAGPADIEILKSVPKTRLIDDGNAADLWQQRKSRFFKPVSGHGGKAVYRGDKLTSSTWQHIRAAPYVAQELVMPGSRRIALPGGRVDQKMDVRLYTYRAETLMVAARIYQGQTTNFRTPGGGFSPLFCV
jgi:hypothetical protein